MNVRGLLPANNPNKVNWIMDIGNMNKAFMMCLTETHLKKKINDNELINPEWNIIRADRTRRMNGGVAIYYKSSLLIDHNKILSYSNSFCEVVGLHFPDLKLVAITIYRPPSCPCDKFSDIIDQIRHWLNDFERDGYLPTLYINGDLNFPLLGAWETEVTENILESLETKRNLGKNISKDKAQAIQLYELISEHSMKQMVKDATRQDNILDIFFSNDPDSISNIYMVENVSPVTILQ